MKRKLLKAKKALRGLFLTMLRDYIVFTITMFLIIFIGIGYIFLRVVITSNNSEFMTEAYKNYTATSIISEGYENINAEKIVETGGWVEILDENKALTKVIGLKKDTRINYTERELLELTNENYKNIKAVEGVYSTVEIFNNKGKVNYCIVKIPVEVVDMSFNIIKIQDDYIAKLGGHIAIVMFVVLPILLVIVIFLYALFTSRNFIKPMKLIKKGVKKMTSGDYSTRIAFQGDNELSEIKDALNFMAEKIEITQGERERSEKLRTQLLMDISHDLKTPITSITGYSKALFDDVVLEEEKKRRYLKIIYDKSLRMTSLINNLHELTKLESDGYEIKSEEQDIGEFLREIIAEVYGEIEGKEFDLEVDIPEEEIYFSFDRVEMARAISNIVCNAIKYNPKNTRLCILLKKKENSIEILICDDGIGVDEELRANIFEPFTRGDSSRRSVGGTGLGLSISKKIIEMHGGRVSLESNEEYKTIFKIQL